jgi:peptide deformylase
VTILRICHFPEESVLRQKARRVNSIDRSIQRLMDNMIETMRSANGVGLAAPQVGLSLRVIVVQMPGEDPSVIINPEIIKRSGEQLVTEGCLSIPGYVGEIKRPSAVTLRGRDRRGRQLRIKGTDLLAEALEHEVDHLNGILFIDRIQGEGK